MLALTRSRLRGQIKQYSSDPDLTKRCVTRSRTVHRMDTDEIAEAKKCPSEPRGSDEASQRDWAPSFWNQHLDNVREMRQQANAPVDNFGADACYDPRAEPKVRRLQILLSLMLSSQTKDEVTSEAMKALRSYGCTVPNLLQIPEHELGELICHVGFWKRKTQYIKRTVQVLREKYKDDIPDTVEALCGLPGVGPKMAHLTMLIAWGECTGIGIDTHMHRICNRLGWVHKPTKTPEATQSELEAWLPK